MSQQNAPVKHRLCDVTCPHCGAQNQTTGDVCWMCRRKFHDGQKVVAQNAPPNFAPQGFSFSLASVFAVMTLVAVGLGLAQIEPGFGIVFIIVACPALVVTFIRTRSERKQGRQPGWGEAIFTFIISSTAMFATLAVTIVALLIALFVICLIIFTIDPIHI